MKLKTHKGLKKFEEIIGGVYFLVFDGEVVYVGQSKDISHRIVTHLKEDKKEFVDVYYINIKNKQEREYKEMVYIKKYMPKYNIATDMRIPKPD